MTAQLSAPLRFLLGFSLLLAFASAGELLAQLLKWPIPGPVIGMLLLWAGLSAGLIKLHWLEDAADGLLGILGLLFVPAVVGIIEFFSAGAAWALWLLTLCSGMLVGAALAGLTATWLVKPDHPSQTQSHHA